MRSIFHTIMGSGGGGYGALTTAYSLANGVSDPVKLTAWTNFEINGASLLSKFKAVYMKTAGSASAVKFNFMNPVDSDAAFRLTLFGGYTYSDSGQLGNGSNSYGNTHINAFNEFTNDSIGCSWISTTNRAFDYGANFGVYDYNLTNNKHFTLIMRPASSSTLSAIACAPWQTYSVTDSSGVWTSNSNSSTVLSLWRNGSNLGNKTKTLTDLPAFKIFDGAMNPADTGFQYADNQNEIIKIYHSGLTDGEIGTLHTLLANLKNDLGL